MGEKLKYTIKENDPEWAILIKEYFNALEKSNPKGCTQAICLKCGKKFNTKKQHICK